MTLETAKALLGIDRAGARSHYPLPPSAAERDAFAKRTQRLREQNFVFGRRAVR